MFGVSIKKTLKQHASYTCTVQKKLDKRCDHVLRLLLNLLFQTWFLFPQIGASLLQELYERILPRLQTTLATPDTVVPHVDPTVPVVRATVHAKSARFIGAIESNNVNFIEQVYAMHLSLLRINNRIYVIL